MAIRDNISYIVQSGGTDPNVAAITIEFEAASGTLGNVEITAVISGSSHEYSNTWIAVNGATTTLYLNRNVSESVTINVKAPGFAKTSRMVTATTQTVSVVLEEVAMTALVFCSDKSVWRTTDGLEYEQVGELPFTPYTNAKLYRNYDGKIIVASGTKYAYSSDEGISWSSALIAGANLQSVQSLKKFNGEYHFIGTMTDKSGSNNYNGYYNTSDITVAPTSRTYIQVRYNTTAAGTLYDMDGDGTTWIGVTGNYIGHGGTYISGGGYDVIFGNGIWVKRESTKIFYAVSPSEGSYSLTWSAATVPSGWIASTENTIYFVDNTFYCFGSYGKVIKSTDGINWTVINNTNLGSQACLFATNGSSILGVRYSGGAVYASISEDMETLQSEQVTNLTKYPYGIVMV